MTVVQTVVNEFSPLVQNSAKTRYQRNPANRKVVMAPNLVPRESLIMLHDVTLCYHVILYYIMLYYIMLCYIILYIVLCCNVML